MTEFNVYNNGDNQPQHLAVLDERPHKALAHSNQDTWVSLCGAVVTGLTVDKVSGLKTLPCKTCDEQLKMRLELAAMND